MTLQEALALLLQARGGSAEAVASLTEGAEANSPYAQRCLGTVYEEGRGVAQNYAIACRWHDRAAAQGDMDSARRLVAIYVADLGGLQDYVLAVRWLRILAEDGDHEAQYQLGLMYEHGQGVERDPRMAEMWCKRAGEDLGG